MSWLAEGVSFSRERLPSLELATGGMSYNIADAPYRIRPVTSSGDFDRCDVVMWWYGDVGEIDVVRRCSARSLSRSGPITWFTVHVYTQSTAQWKTLPKTVPNYEYTFISQSCVDHVWNVILELLILNLDGRVNVCKPGGLWEVSIFIWNWMYT